MLAAIQTSSDWKCVLFQKFIRVSRLKAYFIFSNWLYRYLYKDTMSLYSTSEVQGLGTVNTIWTVFCGRLTWWFWSKQQRTERDRLVSSPVAQIISLMVSLPSDHNWSLTNKSRVVLVAPPRCYTSRRCRDSDCIERWSYRVKVVWSEYTSQWIRLTHVSMAWWWWWWWC